MNSIPEQEDMECSRHSEGSEGSSGSEGESESEFVALHDVRVLSRVVRSSRRSGSSSGSGGVSSSSGGVSSGSGGVSSGGVSSGGVSSGGVSSGSGGVSSGGVSSGSGIGIDSRHSLSQSLSQSRAEVSLCDSLASEDALMLHDILARGESGRLLGNFWSHNHSLARPRQSPSPPPFTVQANQGDSDGVNSSCTAPSKECTYLPPKPPTPTPTPPPVQCVGPESTLLAPSHMATLAARLPMKLQLSKWRMLYSVLIHGADILSFYKLTKGAAHTVIVVETEMGDIFGGFSAEPWSQNLDYYGSGESFVYRIDTSSPDAAGCVEVYPWSYENSFFIWSTNEQVAMGGGHDGFAFVLDADFFTGSSHRSATFQNPPLSTAECFQVVNVEVWGFDSCLY